MRCRVFGFGFFWLGAVACCGLRSSSAFPIPHPHLHPHPFQSAPPLSSNQSLAGGGKGLKVEGSNWLDVRKRLGRGLGFGREENDRDSAKMKGVKQ
jgi:hypothetical protein